MHSLENHLHDECYMELPGSTPIVQDIKWLYTLNLPGLMYKHLQIQPSIVSPMSSSIRNWWTYILPQMTFYKIDATWRKYYIDHFCWLIFTRCYTLYISVELGLFIYKMWATYRPHIQVHCSFREYWNLLQRINFCMSPRHG